MHVVYKVINNVKVVMHDKNEIRMVQMVGLVFVSWFQLILSPIAKGGSRREGEREREREREREGGREKRVS